MAGPANECIPYYKPGADITAVPTAAVTGKRFVVISANRAAGPALNASTGGGNIQVAPAGAGARAIGVAARDQVVGKHVRVIREGVVPVTAGAVITAGQEVESNAAGQAVPLATGKSLGVALSGAASGADAQIALRV